MDGVSVIRDGNGAICFIMVWCDMTAPRIIAVGRIIDGRCELTAIGQDGQPFMFSGSAAEGERFMELLAERDAVSVDEFKNEPQMEVV